MKVENWPRQDWRLADPESLGMRAETLSMLEREIQVRYRSINAFLIVKNGRLVFEHYYNGFCEDDRHLVASVTKSFISALIGIAIDQGYLQGVQQKALDFFPEYTSGLSDPLKQQITIHHLLTMTAGFQWRTGSHNNEYYLDRLRRSRDWVAFVLNLPVRERSVGTFQYNSGVSHLLSAILTRSTGKCARDFAAENLFRPIGIEPPAGVVRQRFDQEDVFRNKTGGWPQDPRGNNTGGWGLFLKPKDLARFGYLYLRCGLWENRQIVPQEWVQESITPHTPEYGYQWWLRDINGVFVYSAIGHGGQHIFCIPEKELVVVAASQLGNRWRDRWPLLEKFVLPALAR